MQDIRISLNTLWSLLDITADLSLTVSFFKAPGSVEKTAISTLFIIVIVPLLSGARVISKVSTLPLPTYISSQSNTLVIHHSPVNCDNTSCKRFFTIHFHQLWYCHPIAGFPGGGSSGKTKKKTPTHQCKRPKKWSFNSWVRKIPWRRIGNPLQHSCLENSMDRGATQTQHTSRPILESCPKRLRSRAKLGELS